MLLAKLHFKLPTCAHLLLVEHQLWQLQFQHVEQRDLLIDETVQFIRNYKHCHSAASYGCGIF